MKVPQLQLTITNAQIGLTTRNAQLQIQQPPADLHIEQPAAELSIQTEEGFFEMDYKQFWEDLGFYSITDVARNFAQKGYQSWQEGVERRAREGRQLADIGKGGGTFAAISKSKNPSENVKPLGIDFIPSYQAIKLHYNPADVQVDIKRNDPIIDVKRNDPIFNYTRGKVELDMLQHPSVKIDWQA